MTIVRKKYDEMTSASREERLAWFKEARLGLFIHYGLFSIHEQGEWTMVRENFPVSEYEEFAKQFNPKPGCTDEWCEQAVRMGAKYCVMTTRHHEGFSLWNSKVNPYNSYNYCGRDLVKEFTDSCRKYGLKIGLYSSVMDWHHPDGGICAYDQDARRRFTDYIEELNVELLSNYGKIDILWYDMPWPMESAESWNSVNRNAHLRELQPHLLINNRSRMAEDFQTSEEKILSDDKYYCESCMTFNGLSWGYIDSEQAKKYSYSDAQILKMLRVCAAGPGNLLLNIGPTPDGSVPEEAKEPLDNIGKWLKLNGAAVYGMKAKNAGGFGMNNVTTTTCEEDKKTLYGWNLSWPKTGTMTFGGYKTAPKKVSFLQDGKEIDFEFDAVNERLILKNLPKECPDKIIGVTVIKLEFDDVPVFLDGSRYPQLHYGYTLE